MTTLRIINTALLAIVCVADMGCGKTKPDDTGPIAPGQYVIVENDDLSHIAVRAYGDMNLWYTLLNANPELAKRPGFCLEKGETLTIPPKAVLNLKLPKSIFPKQLPADYIVMPGDSLPFIAKGCYGDRDLWMRIYDANRKTLSEAVKEDPRRLVAGQVLHIPANDEKKAGQ